MLLFLRVIKHCICFSWSCHPIDKYCCVKALHNVVDRGDHCSFEYIKICFLLRKYLLVSEYPLAFWWEWRRKDLDLLFVKDFHDLILLSFERWLYSEENLDCLRIRGLPCLDIRGCESLSFFAFTFLGVFAIVSLKIVFGFRHLNY